VARNLWIEAVVDAYLLALAHGRDWRAAVVEAERVNAETPLRVLTREDLKEKKGIPFSRQHLARRVREGTFPRPFQAPL
jgi:hypothetical protein